MMFAWALASAACATLPALLTLLNLPEYKPPAAAEGAPLSITMVLPARDEEGAIRACLRAVLASRSVTLQVLVVDDGSTDSTVAIVQSIAATDSRVTLLPAPPLPAGWNGKQHACWAGAQQAATAIVCFLDVDVQIHPDMLAQCAAALRRSRAALISGFPLELTGTLLEQLLLPLIHFVLLGLLPMRLLRTTNLPGFGAGCGQFLMLDREAYLQSGGHAAIRNTMHDGLLMPQLLRRQGFATRLVDLTELATCRMYTSAAATWNGLAKNATEGLAAPARIVPMTLLLALGQVAPLPLLWLAWQHTTFIIPFLGPPVRIGLVPVWLAAVAAILSYLPRLINTVRYRQSWLGAALHPLGVALLLALQWYALIRKLLGRPATWRARQYTPS